jgi:glycosyltransferase involved in cell wall biosynthesis
VRTRKVDQLIASATPGDAVTSQAFGWQRVLAKHGIVGTIFAENVHSTMRDRVQPLRRFPRDGDGVALLHYSIGSAVLDAALDHPAERLGIVYHNITPASYLETVNPAVALLCTRGRARLPQFADRARVVIADSHFNADELTALGFRHVTVIPLLLDLDPTRHVHPSAPQTVLSVGRLVPNKRLDDVIRTVGLVRRHHIPDVRLSIVGSAAGFELYVEALKRFAHAIGCEDAVTFTGPVSDHERDAAYAEAGVYLCMSEHEGFCAPLIEAISHGLPVVAGDAGAIAETLGGAGLVIPDRDPATAAEAVAAVLTDGNLRRGLEGRMARRIAALAPNHVAQEIMHAVKPLLA